MNESQWVKCLVEKIGPMLHTVDSRLKILQGKHLPYANEVLSYPINDSSASHFISYETDLLITESLDDVKWLPRVVIECKINTVTTHDAITYSQKSLTHKTVHPYLRYGILLGNRRHYPLPGRLFRHGLYFDFMQSWSAFEPAEAELNDLVGVIIDEVNGSRCLEEMIFRSRSSSRKRYTLLHKPLKLKP